MDMCSNSGADWDEGTIATEVPGTRMCRRCGRWMGTPAGQVGERKVRKHARARG